MSENERQALIGLEPLFSLETRRDTAVLTSAVTLLLQLNETTRRPPAVPSAQFDSDYAYTVAFGAYNSTNRTAHQTETAKFWYDEDTGSFTFLHAFLCITPDMRISASLMKSCAFCWAGGPA